MRILSLFLPRLSTDRLLRPQRLKRLRERLGEARRPRPDAPPEEPPLAIVAKIKSAMRVVAVSRAAERRGIRRGLTLADARGAVPDLHVVEADEAADRALLEAVADWCDRYTPLVALDPPRGLVLDISGCAHLFAASSGARCGAGDGSTNDDGEAALLADCLQRLTRQGFCVHGAIASTMGAAWAVARYGAGGLVPAGGEADALADLPVAALRIAPEDDALLDRLGLKRIGGLIGKPRAPLTARFGPRLVKRLDQALARADEVVVPRKPAPELSAERRFAEPIAEEPVLLQALASLAETLQPSLLRHGLGARLLEAAFYRVDGEVVRVSVGTAGPVRAAGTVAMLFSERLSALACGWDADWDANWDPGLGFDMVRLAVLASAPQDATQIDLAGEVEGDGRLAELVDRLGARLGCQRVTRFVPVDTHLPERAVRMSPIAEAFAEAPAATPWTVPQAEAEIPPEAPPDRPLRLFPRPEPVEVVAEVPEGPPLRFRWRRVMHDVTRTEGPERIAPEWWRPEGGDRPTRDYYRVEDAAGRRYWIFREGLYGRESGLPVWYLHGLFA